MTKPTQSVWSLLAKLSPKDRKKHLNGGENPKNRAKVTTKTIGGAQYKTYEFMPPEGQDHFAWEPDWKEL